MAEESDVCHERENAKGHPPRLGVQGKATDEGILIIVQRFRPDAFFTAEWQKRLQELMSRFHDACDTGQDLSPEEKQELELLVDAEWQAAIERGAAILRQVPRSIV